MKLIFKQTYTFPVSVASAVVAYLDCEHYIHLHQNCEKKYKIINLTEDKCISEILYKSGLFYWKQISTTEYSNVAEIKQYDISIKGFGPSILANFLNVRTILKYYSNDKDQEVEDIKNNFKLVKLNRNNKITLCEIIYDIDIPFYLYPFKNFLKKKLIKMKRTKDLEDLYMIEKELNYLEVTFHIIINQVTGHLISKKLFSFV